MAVSTVAIGRDQTAAVNAVASMSGGTLTASVFAPTGTNLWVYKFGGRMGRSGASTPSVRIAAYRASGNYPDSLLGYSGTMSPSTAMSLDTATGAWVESDVANAPDDATNAAFRLFGSVRFALAVLATGASLNHGMAAAASISESNENFYTRSGLSQPPPDPFGSYSASVQGHLSLYAYAHTNEAPVAPNNRTPSGTISSTTPEMAGDHRDRNGTWGPGNSGYDDGDQMGQYRIQVRRVSDGATMWAPSAFTASSAERSADRFSVTYAGTALTRGTAYEWRCQTSDAFGEWGTWSDWLEFTPASLGLVTLAGSPSGKIETDEPDFVFTWTHQTSLSTNAVQIRLYQGSTLVYTSGEIADSTAHGASGMITWAESGISDLLWGTSYKYSIRGRDTNGVWSDWSGLRTFNTNAAPSIPDGLSPANGEVVTAYPLLTFQLTDPDDTVATGLVGKVRIKDDAGAVLFTRDATLNTTTGYWEYQTTGTDLATFDAYRWDAYGYDGTLYSGNKTVEANATTSDEELFTYADGPTVTIDAPADASTIDSSTPTVTWTASAQNRYRLTVYAAGTSTAVYTRGPLVSAASSWQVPSGYLRNDTAYDIELWVEDNDLLTGTSQRVTITTDFTPPDAATGVSATPIAIGNDPVETAIYVSWDATTEPGGTYVGTYIYRDDIVGFPYRVFTSPETTSFTDYFPASGHEYTYTVRHVGQRDLDQVESDAVSASAQVNLEGVVIVDVLAPSTYRAVFNSVELLEYQRVVNEQVYTVGSNSKPSTWRSPEKYWLVPGEYRIYPPANTTDKRASITARDADAQALEERDGVFCFRDWEGKVLFGKLIDYIRRPMKLYPSFSFSFREEWWENFTRPEGS